MPERPIFHKYPYEIGYDAAECREKCHIYMKCLSDRIKDIELRPVAQSSAVREYLDKLTLEYLLWFKIKSCITDKY